MVETKSAELGMWGEGMYQVENRKKIRRKGWDWLTANSKPDDYDHKQTSKKTTKPTSTETSGSSASRMRAGRR